MLVSAVNWMQECMIRMRVSVLGIAVHGGPVCRQQYSMGNVITCDMTLTSHLVMYINKLIVLLYIRH